MATTTPIVCQEKQLESETEHLMKLILGPT